MAARREEKHSGAWNAKGTQDDQATSVIVGEKRKSSDGYSGQAVERTEEPDNKRKSSPMSFKLAKATPKEVSGSGISIKVGQNKATETSKKKAEVVIKPKKGSVAAAFNEESDEEEEMPKEAKMRMKNVGKDTATSSGPNSFNKGKQGFTNYGRLWEKEMNQSKD